MTLNSMKAACLAVLVYCARGTLPDPTECKSTRDDVTDQWCVTNCVHGGELHPACDPSEDLATCRCLIEPDPPKGAPVRLKGKYIQLGISGSGKFGVPDAPGFYTRQSTRYCRSWWCKGFAILGDADGFDIGKDLRIDYELPGSSPNAFIAGYTGTDGKVYTGKNFARFVNDISSGGVNLAYIDAQLKDLYVSQRVGFRDEDKHFRTIITLTNKGDNNIDKVRYVHTLDPDTSHDMDGNYYAYLKVLNQTNEGDNASAVLALGPQWGSYKYYSGKQARLMYVSGDASSVASHTPSWKMYSTSDIYWDGLIEKAPKADSPTRIGGDLVHMTFDVGTLTPGTSKTVSFWTVVDNVSYRTIDESIRRVEDLVSVIGCRSLNSAVPDSWCRGSWPSLPTNCFDGAGQMASACRYTIDPHEVQHVCEC